MSIITKNNFIVIEGNIGAGKSTLSQMISEELGAKLIHEQFVENPFLPKFYDTPDKYAFQLEMSFLADRYKQLNDQIANQELFSSFTISDYYFPKSLIFAQITLKDDEYHLYKTLFNIIYDKLPKPDLYVYLHLPEDKLIDNIKTRGRDYEQNIAKTYLEDIRKGYMKFLNQQTDFPVLILDRSDFDFIGNPSDYTKIKDIILDRKYDIGINRLNDKS